MKASADNVNWLVENRGGFAWLTGLLLIPSQFLGPNAESSNEKIAQVAQRGTFKIRKFSLPVAGSSASVKGVVYYPKGWDPSDRSRCVVYHNPNGVTVSQFFEKGRLSWTPQEIMKWAQCPIVLYDYRGTGLSSEDHSFGSFAFRPTYESIVVDGEAVLRYAFKQSQSVKVFGSSLGGGVATVSLERHIEAHPVDARRASLFNHDSFSTTAKVVMPNWPVAADWLGWAVGGLVDAETSMKNLVEKEIPITVLCHEQDPVIPRGARMADWIESMPWKRSVSLIYSPRYGHADLSQDMVLKLGRI